jgi:hypothetical protein
VGKFARHSKITVYRIIRVENKEIIRSIEGHLKSECSIEPEITPFYLLDMPGYISMAEKGANKVDCIVS